MMKPFDSDGFQTDHCCSRTTPPTTLSLKGLFLERSQVLAHWSAHILRSKLIFNRTMYPANSSLGCSPGFKAGMYSYIHM
jgi:hypothetical protein